MSNILHSQARSDVLAHVSGNLRRLRQALRMSQAALAEASGISRRMIVAVEAGDANISLSSLDKLAAAMGAGFVDLVRDPEQTSFSDIREVTWRGREPESEGILLGTAPAAREAQMWLWSLGGCERYDAEPDPQGWHEMIFVVEGVLTLMLGDAGKDYPAGTFAIYSSAQVYSYVNAGQETVKFVRNVIS
ncbi:XRE family transcriptional regulator (plasmid) [Ensifer adhaerens]|uniref:helix-turn-helix domain-containing protein n=1 Tax=Ensifer adhaerens TaxID=106592 RepID=UPI0023A95239|nr:XRE family transcriptional regulator [Ensifer adhaerens]WDZ79120.1 XRE family transcriptional regulator [Ensifer adhaerens]